MMEMGALDTHQVKVLVLDEVDIMLSRGFEDQVHVPKLFIVHFIFLCYYLCTVDREIFVVKNISSVPLTSKF